MVRRVVALGRPGGLGLWQPRPLGRADRAGSVEDSSEGLAPPAAEVARPEDCSLS
jgi:hypothetical protein